MPTTQRRLPLRRGRRLAAMRVLLYIVFQAAPVRDECRGLQE